MEPKKILQRGMTAFLSLSRKNQVALIVLIIALVYWFATMTSKNVIAGVDSSPESRIQQVNMNQGKLCLLKINAKSCVYFEEKKTAWDMMPFQIGYTHLGEVDIVVDLTNADVSMQGDRAVIKILEPHIDMDTVNIRPQNLKVEHYKPGLRTTEGRNRLEQEAINKIPEDLMETVKINFPKAEAKRQALQVLRALYSMVGCENVDIQFISNNSDF